LLDIRDRFGGERPLVGDGAMGTLLDERGIGYPYDRANLLAPDAVRAAHAQYLRAGADVLELSLIHI
jgi:homocysteine S-methyltransferase